MPPSYVFGSSRAVCTLTDAERERLDREPWVFCCNHWVSHWEKAGFRPSVWVWGDTDRPIFVERFATELWVIRNDRMLAVRPTQRFVALEDCADMVQRAIISSGLAVNTYRRHFPWDETQQPADRLAGRIFHYGSTLTDMVNLAWLLNPGQEIRVFGNEMSDSRLHFYDSTDATEHTGNALAFWRKVKTWMWEGLRILREAGIPVVDCNPSHDWGPSPIPTQRLFDD
jgi:hypothetical protein